MRRAVVVVLMLDRLMRRLRMRTALGRSRSVVFGDGRVHLGRVRRGVLPFCFFEVVSRGEAEVGSWKAGEGDVV